MPAVIADSLTLPRIEVSSADVVRSRGVSRVVDAPRQTEGNGFIVRRPLPSVAVPDADPFLLLDHMGGAEVEFGPGEAVGTPWHPHRGFETVTYLLNGYARHRDSLGGGGNLGPGDTQWMTAGSGILHIEEPSEEIVRSGGPLHGVQLWVNLPASAKFTPPRYQDLRAESTTLLASADGASLVRLIAGNLGGHRGPGETVTPIVYAHATIPAGSQMIVPWPSRFSALAYVLAGHGTAGPAHRPLVEGQLAIFGPGASLTLEAASTLPGAASVGWEVLLLGGLPISEPIARYGPFVMNTEDELRVAFDDFRAGRMGQVPADVDREGQ